MRSALASAEVRETDTRTAEECQARCTGGVRVGPFGRNCTSLPSSSSRPSWSRAPPRTNSLRGLRRSRAVARYARVGGWCCKLSAVLHLVHHPLVHECLAGLRSAHTDPERFRSLANRISVLLGAEALRDVPTEDGEVQTPLGPAPCRRLAVDVVVAPVLRAGLGMLPGMLELVPDARVGHLGLQRDERTAVASQYYAKLPPHIEGSYVLLIDPMLATGGSAVAALDMLTRAGAKHIRLV